MMVEYVPQMFSWIKKQPKRPDAALAMKRAIVLKHVFVKGAMVPTPDALSDLRKGKSDDENRALESGWTKQFGEMSQRLRQIGLWGEMSSKERRFIQASPNNVTKQEMVDCSWTVESIASLLWALGFLPEIPPWDQQIEPQITNRLPQLPVQELVRSAKLRPDAEIEKAREIAKLWHWRSRTRQLQEAGRMPALVGGKFTIQQVLKLTASKANEAGDIPTPIGDDFPAFGKAYRDLTAEEFASTTSIAQERHRALNWLCGMAPGNRWEETPTDT